MEGIFTKEEVLVALKELNGDKAPGPDGFISAFWQSSWDIVRGEVMGMFRDFFANGKFVHSMNFHFLGSHPKKRGYRRPNGF